MENERIETMQQCGEERDYTPKTLSKWIALFFEGMVIGVGAILPGVSGGVLCVVFGIYPPMMELLAHPIKSIPKYYKLFIPVILGWVVGFLALAGVIADLAAKNEVLVTSLFIGLIVGMFPSLFREGAREGRTKGCWAALILSTLSLLTLFFVLKYGTGISVTPNIGWFLFCGAFWGISLIVPGMSSSSVLMFLGLYYPMSAGIAKLDPAVLIPFLIGIIVTVLLLARGVNTLFKRYYGIAFHCIIGFVIASTVPIVPTAFSSALELVFALLLGIAGFFIAFFMDRFGDRIMEKRD